MIRLTDNRSGENAALLERREDSCLCYECSKNRKLNDRRQTVPKEAKILLSLLRKCADKPLRELRNDDLIVFAKEKDLDQHFISLRAQPDPEDAVRIDTGNMMGVLSVREKGSSLKVQIKSRFDTGAKQYFLNYLLSKVCDVNFAELVSSNDDVMWDLLLAFVFVWKFRKAAEVGLYKQYHTNRYNDLNFRGKLDLDRHLQRNYPLCDRIAYSKREITFDNPLNHLLRFAAAKIERKWPSMLESGRDVRNLVTALKQATPSWNSCGTAKILNHKDCRFPVRQPFFAEYYEPLRKIARMLLLDEGANIFDDAASESKTEISGVIFDGSWLWEEYIATILTDYTHAEYPIKGGIRVFAGEEKPIFYPDFLSDDNKVVLDTKYKKSSTGEPDDIQQVICYMYLTGAVRGGLIFPPGESNNTKLLTICRGNQKPVRKWQNFIFSPIPDNETFSSYMEREEQRLKEFSAERSL